MNRKLKIIGITLLSSILVLGILFFVQPSFWLKFLFPVKVEIRAANTIVSEDEIAVDLQLILKDSKVLKYFSDSVNYMVFIDGDVLVDGFCNVNKSITNGEIDTMLLPVSLRRNVLKSKTSKFEKGDSTNLRLVFTNYVDLPVLGVMEIPIERVVKVAAPQAPEVSVLNVKKIKLKLKEAIYELELDVYNPNYAEIILLSADVYIDIKGLFKGNVRSPGLIKILPEAHSKITARIDLDEFNLVNDGLKIVFKPQKEWEYYAVAKVLIAQNNAEPIELLIKNSGKTKLLGLK